MVWEMYFAQCVWLLLLVLVPRIFPFGFLQNTLWVISLGVCGGLCLLCWGCISALYPPSVWQGLFGNWNCWCFLCVRIFYLFPLEGFSQESTPFKPQWKICSDCIGGGGGFASPKCCHRLPPPNLPWASPLPNQPEFWLFMLGGLVCTNRYGFCTDYNRDWDFPKSNFKKKKKKPLWGGGQCFANI